MNCEGPCGRILREMYGSEERKALGTVDGAMEGDRAALSTPKGGRFKSPSQINQSALESPWLSSQRTQDKSAGRS